MAFRQRLEFEIEGHDDPIEVEYSAIDLRAWEREHDKSILVEATSMSILSWLAWHAATRQGVLNGATGASWADFDKTCIGVRSIRGSDVARPTETPASGDSSLPS